jgi:uncharacterized membrane protein YphA (DoxX/SURF4 family)
MMVAAFAVHIDNGWLAISEQGSAAGQHLQEFLAWVKLNHPHRFTELTEFGQPVMLNNGVEFAVTYSIMLLSLFFSGAGEYFSLDYWFKKYVM